jgi:mRNA interferase MazF
MNKDFDKWNDLKKKLEIRKRLPNFEEREIWWTSIGINVGDEMCGKSDESSRPVLILKKFNNHFFFAVPLSSVQKDNKYYFNFTLNDKKQAAIMCQAKPVSANRLSDKYGKVGAELFRAIKKKTGDVLLNLS